MPGGKWVRGCELWASSQEKLKATERSHRRRDYGDLWLGTEKEAFGMIVIGTVLSEARDYWERERREAYHHPSARLVENGPGLICLNRKSLRTTHCWALPRWQIWCFSPFTFCWESALLKPSRVGEVVLMHTCMWLRSGVARPVVTQWVSWSPETISPGL